MTRWAGRRAVALGVPVHRLLSVCAFSAVLALSAFGPAVHAQGRPRPADPVPARTPSPTGPERGGSLPPQGAMPRATLDTVRRSADSTDARKPLVEWAPDDSIMLALLARKGYKVVRYQAHDVGFATAGRTMTLSGSDSARAVVQRDSTILVAPAIAYSDSTRIVSALGDTIIMRGPLQRDDVYSHGELTYDVERREGKTREFSTVANAGEDWRVEAHRAAFSTDSTGEHSTVLGRGGLITSCLDSVPHYHFLARELKRVSGKVIVARPAILYVQDVPVMWLPFIFQDIRTGRRSGILTPRVGASELIRNSATYRRTAENLGYYFAINDYMDAQVSLDWRSSARATVQDPGWLGFNGQVSYRWLDRFLSGGMALSQKTQSDGTRFATVSWFHSQEFSSRTRFTTNLNYSSNTFVQRQTLIDPLATLATIGSTLNLVRQQGPFSVNLGGTRKQYPGRSQVDQSFPTLNIASRPLSIGDWFVLTPSAQYTSTQNLNLDATGDFAYRYVDRGGVLDSVRLKRNTSNTSLNLSTPFKIFNFQVQSGFRLSERLWDYPQIITVRDPVDTAVRIERVFSGYYESNLDFDVSVGLPQFLQGTWNLGPSITLANVDPSGFAVRSVLSNGAWVTQSKRLSYAVGVSPTLFHLYPGFGRVLRFRHAITPTLQYGYSPAASVSDEFLAAVNRTRQGYLGAMAQNRLTFGLATNIEAKLRSASDTTNGEGEKIKVLSLQFTSLSYDFERKRQTGKTGFATSNLSYTARSDLLPGFDLGVDYSLFQGNPMSDTAKFSPYREAVRASFSVDANSAIVRLIGGLLGASPAKGTRGGGSMPTQQLGGGGREMPPGSPQGFGAATGMRSRSAVQEIPTGQGFSASFTVSAQRQRPPVGGRVAAVDPTARCQQFLGTFQYDYCVRQAQQDYASRSATDLGPPGGTYFSVPPTTSVGIRTGFNLTPLWAASWNTSYDVERHEFAMQVVTLQRDMHDWRAIFGFTKSPNGNFAFTFFVSLKAQPEIKLDYDRQSYRSSTGVPYGAPLPSRTP